MATIREDVTRLLTSADRAEPGSADQLVRLLYDELRRVAHRELAREGHRSLRTTELVHEAYLRLSESERVGRKGRAYFFAAASQAMRRILVDRARRRSRVKRGGERRRVTLDGDIPVDDFAHELLDLDLALERFEAVDPRAARVVECHFFGGMTMDEVAEAVDVSLRTVKRDWATAKAWLQRALDESDAGAAGP